MNKKGIIIIVVLLMLLNVASIGFMWWKNNPHLDDNRQHEKITDFVVHELNLDKKQQETYQQMIKAHHEAMGAEDKILRGAKDDFFELINAEKIDSLQIQAAADKIGKEESKANMITLNHFLALKSICNEAQKHKLESLLKDILHKMRNNGPGPRRNGEVKDGMRPPPRDYDKIGENPPPPPPGEGDQEPPRPPRP